MSLEINKINGVNPFEKAGAAKSIEQQKKLNSVFAGGQKANGVTNDVQGGENEYFSNAINNGEVAFKKSFMNLSNSYNFKVGDDETLAKFGQKMGLSPETLMDNIIGGGSDLNCNAPMAPDGSRYINVGEKDLATALGKSPQELREMFT